MKRFFTLLLSIGFLLTGCGGGGGGGETASGSSGYNTTTAPAAGGGGAAVVADTVLNGQFTAGGTPAAASLEQTLVVTVQAVGNANKYFIDGVQQDTLALEVGITYTLDQSDNSNAGHPLRFSITDDGTHSGGVEYTADITTNGTAGQAGAYTRIAATAGTPNALFYYCTNHAGMGGQAGVTNVGGANNAAVNGVQGLSYATETQSGITDSTGAFTYKSGETIQFSIGNFLLGDAVLAVEDMTPVDLVPGVVLPTNSYDIQLFRYLIEFSPGYSKANKANRWYSILTFLQAIDADKDISNGTTIADGMDTLLEGSHGANIDFDDPNFSGSKGFRYFLGAALQANLIDNSSIPKDGEALDDFLNSQGLSYTAKSIETSLIVYENGPPDSTETFTYDDNGLMLTKTANTTGIESYTYDANGNITYYSHDTDGDGTAEEVRTYTYNSNDLKTHEYIDSNNDGQSDQVLISTYDDYHNLVRRQEQGGDGVDDAITDYTYDADGNLTLEEYDTNADGSANSTITRTYDGNGYEISVEHDSDGDGVANRLVTITYDSNGCQLSYIVDTNGDGQINSDETFTCDSDGNRLTHVQDTNGNGVTDVVENYTLNAYGQRTNLSKDSNNDGTIDLEVDYTFDNEGKLLSVNMNNNNAIDITTYSFDNNGYMVSLEEDTNGDGVAESVKTYTNDGDGYPISESNDTNNDGASDVVTTLTYINSTFQGVIQQLDMD